MRKEHGFNLIELMVVVTIIGILAGIAVPAYQHYVTRARAAHMVAAVAGYKTAIEIAVETSATSTAQELKENAVGIPGGLSGDAAARYYLTSLTVANGIITANGNPLVNGTEYILTPHSQHGKITSPVQWTASGNCVTSGLCPEIVGQNGQPATSQSAAAAAAGKK